MKEYQAWSIEVIYTRGIRRVEGSADDNADYKRETDGRITFHTKNLKGDYIVRETHGPHVFKEETWQLQADLARNTPYDLSALPGVRKVQRS